MVAACWKSRGPLRTGWRERLRQWCFTGSKAVQAEQQKFTLAEADTACAPGCSAVSLHNAPADALAFILIADETPLDCKLGVFEQRG